MNRLSNEQKNIIKSLHSEGLSLRNIQQKTDIPLSTLQYNLNKNSGRKRIKQLILPKSEFILGEIIGAFCGDGSYFHSKSKRSGKYLVRYFLSYRDDMEYANYLHSVFKKMNLNPFFIIRKNKGIQNVIEVRISSIKLIELIKSYVLWEEDKTYSVRLIRSIKSYSKDFLFGFARGMMDTDGFVETYNVACGVISKRLIENLSDIFSIVNLNSKITIRIRPCRRDLYLLRVPKKSLEIYYKNIGFSNLRKEKKLLGIIGNKSGSARI